MRKSPLLAFLATWLLLAAPLGFAGYYPHNGAGVSIYIPDHWVITHMDDVEINAATADDTVGMAFAVFNAADAQAAWQALESWVMQSVSDFTPTGSYEFTLNGMPAVAGEANGYIDGIAAEIALMVVLTPNNQALMVFGAGEQGAVNAYQGDIDQILANIAPL